MKNFNIAILRPKFSQVFFLFQGCDRENGVEPGQKKTPFFGQEASADLKKTISRTDQILKKHFRKISLKRAKNMKFIMITENT